MRLTSFNVCVCVCAFCAANLLPSFPLFAVDADSARFYTKDRISFHPYIIRATKQPSNRPPSHTSSQTHTDRSRSKEKHTCAANAAFILASGFPFPPAFPLPLPSAPTVRPGPVPALLDLAFEGSGARGAGSSGGLEPRTRPGVEKTSESEGLEDREQMLPILLCLRLLWLGALEWLLGGEGEVGRAGWTALNGVGVRCRR